MDCKQIWVSHKAGEGLSLSAQSNLGLHLPRDCWPHAGCFSLTRMLRSA